MSNNSTSETIETKEVIKRVRELKEEKKFERIYFDEEFRKTIRAKDWEDYKMTRVPSRLSEIVKIGHGTIEADHIIDIDISEPGKDQLLLCFIIYFARGKTSAVYNKNPFGFIIQTPEFRNRVLDAKLRIKIPKESTISAATELF